MKTINQLTPEDINKMSYNELIGVTRETNRPPGGYSTVAKICHDTFLNSSSQVLEIGTSTGFTAIEIARLTDANVTAIDINVRSLEEATFRAKKRGVANKIIFEVNDATNLSYTDSSFDVVFCGNVTSYVPNRAKALEEYTRVLRDGGFLAAVPMYYLQKPSKDLIRRVSKAIKYDINPDYKLDWIDFFTKSQLELISSQDYRFDKISNTRVERFVENILKKEHLLDLTEDTRTGLSKKYTSQINLFAENLSQMGYTIMLLRKENFKIDEELFTGTPLTYDKT